MMEWQTRVRVKEHKKAHPLLYGATGHVMWHALQDMIVVIRLDEPREGIQSHYGPNFHSVAVEALEVIE